MLSNKHIIINMLKGMGIHERDDEHREQARARARGRPPCSPITHLL